jgi:hypothetical protein
MLDTLLTHVESKFVFVCFVPALGGLVPQPFGPLFGTAVTLHPPTYTPMSLYGLFWNQICISLSDGANAKSNPGFSLIRVFDVATPA